MTTIKVLRKVNSGLKGNSGGSGCSGRVVQHHPNAARPAPHRGTILRDNDEHLRSSCCSGMMERVGIELPGKWTGGPVYCKPKVCLECYCCLEVLWIEPWRTHKSRKLTLYLWAPPSALETMRIPDSTLLQPHTAWEDTTRSAFVPSLEGAAASR